MDTFVTVLAGSIIRNVFFREALKEIKMALEVTKDDPIIFDHLGDVYLKLDDRKRAIDAWQKALEFHEKEEGLKEQIENKIKDLKGFDIEKQ